MKSAAESTVAAGGALLALVFATGHRPDINSIVRLQDQVDDQAFSITHKAEKDGWAELLARGMTFDCHGLAPTAAVDLPQQGSLLGLASFPEGEAIALRPGPHLAGGKGLLPVVRTLAGLGTSLAALPGILAVRWLPAQTWMTPDYFIRLVKDWLVGGAFPALGLTGLERQDDGSMVSRGLELLVGQEIRFDPPPGMVAMQVARIAVRLVHLLIEQGAMQESGTLVGPDGETLLAVPVRDRTRLHVSVQG